MKDLAGANSTGLEQPVFVGQGITSLCCAVMNFTLFIPIDKLAFKTENGMIPGSFIDIPMNRDRIPKQVFSITCRP